MNFSTKVQIESERSKKFDYDPDTQKHDLREFIKRRLFKILYAELGLLVALIFLQGFELNGFKLNEYVFSVFSSGVLIQTFLLLRYVVMYSFDRKKSN